MMIQPELRGRVIWVRQMASRGFESGKRRALVCVPICSVHQCCLECGPDCGVRRRSRIHEFRGSTFGPTAVANAVNNAGWLGKVKYQYCSRCCCFCYCPGPAALGCWRPCCGTGMGKLAALEVGLGNKALGNYRCCRDWGWPRLCGPRPAAVTCLGSGALGTWGAQKLINS
jgi:hypothetical protein